MEEGQQFGRYELISRIAMGGMAEIFLARETGLAGFERLVILKRVLPGLAEDIDFIDMFLDEARLAARLTHPNIVHIYELGEERGSYYIAMEYVPGGDLHELLRRRQGRLLPLPDTLHIIGEVCGGLQFAHALAGPDGESLGVVHRDVTPKNVLLSVDGIIKVVDFGIAKARAKLSVTRPGDIKGTFSYMAPEQARGERVDRRADIYAVGALTYRLATGTPAYPQVGDSLLSAVRASQFVRPRKINPELPPAIEDIILRAMALDPRDRYPTCGALRRDIAEVARQLDILGDPETLAPIVRESFPSVLGVTAPIDSPPLSPRQRPTSVETPMREAMALASPDESTGLVSFGPNGVEEDDDGTLEEFSPFDPSEEDQTDMLLLPEDLQNAGDYDELINDPTAVLVPDHLGHPGPPSSGSLIDLFEPPTVRSDLPSDLAPPQGGMMPGPVGPPPVGPPPMAANPNPYGVLENAPTSAMELPPYPGHGSAQQLPFPDGPPGQSPHLGAVVEPAITPTGTDIVPGRRKRARKRSRRGLALIIAGFALGVTLIASALILILSPEPRSTAQAETMPEGPSEGIDPSLVSTGTSTAGLISASPATEPDLPDSAVAPAFDAGPAPQTDVGPIEEEEPLPPIEEEEPLPPIEEEEPPTERPTKTAPLPREDLTPSRHPRSVDSSPRVVKVSSKRPVETKRQAPSEPAPSKTPRGGATSGSSGFLTVFTVPSSKVYLGSRLLGNSPIAKRQVPAGAHSLKLVGPTGNKTVRIQVKAGEHTRIRQRL